MHKGRTLRRLGGLAGVVGLGAVAVMPVAAAQLDSGGSYTVVARADALAIEYVNTAAPVFGENAVIYGTPATAGSVVDSVGRSSAFASAPYPGDVMVGLPDNGKGVAAGLGGPPELVPTYPFYVQSDYPIKPSATQDQSGNRLVANSEQHASSSDARSGLITGDMLAALQAQASSAVAVDAPTGKITAAADSRLDAFRVTDKLQIGKSSSHARLIQEPGQPIVKESSFTVGSIIVNGVEVGFSDQGFHAGDQSPPNSEPPGALFEPLKQAGISVEFLPATGTDSSIESAGMRITQVQTFAGQTQRVSFILGRVSARIDGSATPATDLLLDPVGGDQSSSNQAVTALAPAPPTAAEDFVAAEPAAPEFALEAGSALEALPDLSLPAAFDGAVDSPSAGVLGGAAQAGPTPGAVRLASPAALGRGLRDDDYGAFYLALAAALAVTFLASRLLGALGAGAASAGGGSPASVLNLPR